MKNIKVGGREGRYFFWAKAWAEDSRQVWLQL